MFVADKKYVCCNYVIDLSLLNTAETK